MLKTLRKFILLVVSLLFVLFHSQCTYALRTSSRAAPPKFQVVLSTNINNAETITRTTTTEERKDETISQYVLHILNARLVQVLSGKRQQIFSKRLNRLIAKNRNIVSAHGRQSIHTENGEDIEFTTTSSQSQQDTCQSTDDIALLTSDENKYTETLQVFPSNILSLDMVYTPKIHQQVAKQIARKIQKEGMQHDYKTFSDNALFLPRLLLRSICLGINFTPVISTAGLAMLSSTFRDQIWYKLIGGCASRCGPAFIKWGQWASTRPDMFPDELCSVLSKLHAGAPAHSWFYTQRSIEDTLCLPRGKINEVFSSIDRQPVASGSIAQVHRAVLRQTPEHDGDEKSYEVNTVNGYENKREKGSLVAVKVRHPNVSRLIDMDFRLMSMAARIIDNLPGLSWLGIRESLEQFSHTMAAQTHLNVEAHHLEVLNHNFRNWATVGFPKPIFASVNVIIESFERGHICTEILDAYDNLAISNHKAEPPTSICTTLDEKQSVNDTVPEVSDVIPTELSKFLVTNGVSIYLKMLLVDNLMHADLHPGNLMVNCWKDETINMSNLLEIVPNMRLTLVDAGMVAKLDDDESHNFITLLSSCGEGDARSAANAVLRFCSSNEESDSTNCIDEQCYGGLTKEEREQFIEDMVVLFAEECKGYGSNTDLGNVLRGVLGIVKKYRVRINANYATLVVNALCIESLAKRICPSYNVLDASKPLFQFYRAIANEKHEHITKETKARKRQASKLKSRLRLMKLLSPLLYKQKSVSDNIFFNKMEATNRRKNKSRKNLNGFQWIWKQSILILFMSFIMKSDNSIEA